MNATFLHDHKSLPSDEIIEAPAPECRACGKPMWLIRVTRRASDDGLRDVCSYECRGCGTLTDTAAQSPSI